MFLKHMKNVTFSLIVRKLLNENTIILNLESTRLAEFKKFDNTLCLQVFEKTDTHTLLTGTQMGPSSIDGN